MSMLDKQTRGDLVKLIIFIVVTTLATGVLVVLIGNLSFEATRTYKAVFSDATGVVKGDDIRIAGVKVGSVKNVEIVDRTRARVTFTVAKTSMVTKSSTATIRYRNLVGQRYISLTQGVGNLDRLPENATIPMEPDPAGARPHRAVQRVQAAVRGALARPTSTSSPPRSSRSSRARAATSTRCCAAPASLTNTLADRDQVIGDVIDNLNAVLEHARRSRQAAELT